MPSGPLREPLHSLNKAHIVVINGREISLLKKKLGCFQRELKFFILNKIRRKPKVKNKKILAFAEIEIEWFF